MPSPSRVLTEFLGWWELLSIFYIFGNPFEGKGSKWPENEVFNVCVKICHNFLLGINHNESFHKTLIHNAFKNYFSKVSQVDSLISEIFWFSAWWQTSKKGGNEHSHYKWEQGSTVSCVWQYAFQYTSKTLGVRMCTGTLLLKYCSLTDFPVVQMIWGNPTLPELFQK